MKLQFLIKISNYLIIFIKMIRILILSQASWFKLEKGLSLNLEQFAFYNQLNKLKALFYLLHAK